MLRSKSAPTTKTKSDTTEECLSIFIESKEISEVMKSMFDLAFEEAKRLNKINKYLGQYKKSLDKYKDSVP